MLLADDHPLVNRGLAREIEETPGLTLVASAYDGDEAIALIETHIPDVALLDIDMPKRNGLDVLRAVVESGLPTRVLMLTGSVQEDMMYTAISGGASGYLVKTTDWPDIMKAIRDVANGQTVVDPSMAHTLVGALQSRRAQEDARLTDREREVLTYTATDLTARQIGSVMNLSERMIKKNLTSIYSKLGVSSKAQAVAEAIRRGLVN